MNCLSLGFIDGVGDNELGLGKELLQSQNGTEAMDVDPLSAEVKPNITGQVGSPATTPCDAMSSALSPVLSTNNTKPLKFPESPGPSRHGVGLSARKRNRLKWKLKTNSTFITLTSSTAKNNAASQPAPPLSN